MMRPSWLHGPRDDDIRGASPEGPVVECGERMTERIEAATAARRMPNGFRATVADWRAKLPTPDGRQFVVVLERGELTAELYRPVGHDPQKPHTRDEIYVVVDGSGDFVIGGERVPFGPGDLLFVPAGLPHRFENFGESVTVWVIFYGPEGGDPTA
jgi:mannose-6-phosphate isomerase-like protein (cupin superfamily)